MKRYILAITGASGALLGVRLLKELIRTTEIHLIISSTALRIIDQETGINWQEDTQEMIRSHLQSDKVFFYDNANLFAPVSSGSFRSDGMFVVPCSMKTLSAIAQGYADNLIERAADVTIKERRKLILSPREMPFSAIHLENMLSLAHMGVIISPPVPAFYHRPETMDDLINFIIGKILDSMSIHHDLFKRWGE